ncbi:molybdenum cofactor biosynthesis protein MoaE [Sphingobacterium sp. BIGb0165]|uniref:molybdenum cofactor biosynthesis protein MoaE n=1 Tax=Sphingobacterium sp. BIGb0165 TaxID=2940615 RepID=UPI002168E8C4|nr:molybdenum cofactor biosynthesis protein MoaE [Sphingobacterium sp. BIGb0165]MCS4226289.1 molybdopterin synthase catalytic subunit [Sphingobacterium sp. BIGb0165]
MTKQKNDIFIQGPIAPQQIAATIVLHGSKPEIGAHSIFLGQIRADQVEGKTVRSIDYSINWELALSKMTEIREAVFDKYSLTCMHVYHSEGLVEVGGICFFVFTSSVHRQAAMDACGELVERIKKEMPIWGKEIFEDDTHQWKTNR